MGFEALHGLRRRLTVRTPVLLTGVAAVSATVVVAVLADGPARGARLVTYATPGAAPSEVFEVRLLQGERRRRSFVHESTVPEKTYKEDDGADRSRPRSLSWTTFAFTGRVTVEVRRSTPFSRAVVRPASARIRSRAVDSHTVRFTLRRPMTKVSVEFDGDPSNALLLFGDPPEHPSTVVRAGRRVYTHRPGAPFRVPPHATAVRFVAGVHDVGYWEVPRTVRRVYVAGGAVVYGALNVSSPRFRLTGRGVLSGRRFPWRALKDTGAHHTGECWVDCIKMVDLNGVTSGLIDGVTISDPPYYTITPGDSRNVTMRNVKIVGGWRWNSDGAELPESSSLSDCFIHANDDAIKAYHSNLDVRRCVVWKGPNGPLVQTGWDVRTMSNVRIADIDLIHVEGSYAGATNTGLVNNQFDPATLAPDGTGLMSDLVFRRIRSEEPVRHPVVLLAPPGQTIRGVRILDLSVPAYPGADAANFIRGVDGGRVEDVEVRNMRVGGVRVTEANAQAFGGFDVDPDSTSGVTFR